jgi:NADPH2:quinone reductase
MNRLDTQQCIMITAAGGPDVLQPRTVEVPSPLDDEVLIQVYAAGVSVARCPRIAISPGWKSLAWLPRSGAVYAIFRSGSACVP